MQPIDPVMTAHIRLLNRVSASFTGIDSNASPANAPVSYPFLWNASQLSWEQWNGSANNHIGRNVGEVLGVFEHTIVNTPEPLEQFESSAKIVNLDRLENLMSQLDSPKWQAPLPPIDQNKAAKGNNLFARNCAFCHGVRDENGQFPMTAPNPLGKQFIKINMIALDKIGTDPMMAMNFVNPALNVDPGAVIRKFLPAEYQDAAEVPRWGRVVDPGQECHWQAVSSFQAAAGSATAIGVSGIPSS